MYVNYMIVPVAAFEYSMARKLVNCKPSIPVSEKNRKEQILFPLFHTENNFLSFFITEIVKSIIPETNCLIIDFLLSLYYMLLIKSITDSLFCYFESIFVNLIYCLYRYLLVTILKSLSKHQMLRNSCKPNRIISIF